MNDRIQQALQRDLTIDITTTGRKSGQQRRTEIWFHNIDGRIFLSGTPGTRDWYANLAAHPEFTFHLKESLEVDIPATAAPITDIDTRREIMTKINAKLGRDYDIESWVAGSPLIEVTLRFS